MTEIAQKFKHLFEFRLPFVSGVVFNYLIRTGVRKPSLRCLQGVQRMSTLTLNSGVTASSAQQGLSKSKWLTNPSGIKSFTRFSRRGRLARTLVVLSLTVVMAAGLAAKSGAGNQVVQESSYVSVVVPGGATLWSVASAYSTGDVAAMVEQIREVNDLQGYDVTSGQRLRVPIK